jgi:hypothetical protein
MPMGGGLAHGGRGHAVAGGSGEPEREVPPEELFQRLKPFKDRVADDIRGDQE